MNDGRDDELKNAPDEARIDDLLTLAALGELTAAEEAELDAALAADAQLAAELDADAAVAARLQATHAEAPPAGLKASVMAAIDALDPSVTDPSAVGHPQLVSMPLELPPLVALPPEQPLLVSLRRAQRPVVGSSTSPPPSEPVTRRRWRAWQPLAAAAAVVMLLVGGVLVAGRNGSDGGSTFEAVATADDGQRRTLEGELGGTLDVVYSPSRQAFVLVGTDIPALTDEQTYQLWLVDDAGAQPVGLFRPDGDGRVEQVFADLDPSDFVVGVTIEPAAGSQTPTLPILAAA